MALGEKQMLSAMNSPMKIIQPGMTTYQKVKACYDYLIQNAEYDYSGGALRVRSGYNSFNDAITVTEADI